jgi:hypothetical protein
LLSNPKIIEFSDKYFIFRILSTRSYPQAGTNLGTPKSGPAAVSRYENCGNRTKRLPRTKLRLKMHLQLTQFEYLSIDLRRKFFMVVQGRYIDVNFG